MEYNTFSAYLQQRFDIFLTTFNNQKLYITMLCISSKKNTLHNYAISLRMHAILLLPHMRRSKNVRKRNRKDLTTEPKRNTI